MADQNINPNNNLPQVQDIQPGAEMSGGLINPLSLTPIEIDLPGPPASYPPAVQPTGFIPTQKGFPSGSESGAQKIFELAETADTWAKNPNHYGKVQAYNADYDGVNFKRYANVPSVFNKEGVSFFRDNESLYNENASWWDYYKRSASSGLDLFKTGFTDMLPWNAWDFDDADETAAIEMERAHAIGHDTRGGLGAWVNNMTVDSGYTFGILGEMAVEELGLWAGTALTGGLGAAGAITETGANIAKGGKAFSKIWDLKNMYSQLNKTYDWLNSADKMKDIYTAAKSGVKSGAAWAAEQLTPETLKFGKELFQSGRKGEIVFDAAKAAKGFGSFYRDMRAYSGVMSEASLEGGSTELRVRDQLIDEYRESHNGEMPKDEDLLRIYTEAANAGRETYLWNLPALFISNKIVFDKALKGFKPISAFREELEQGIKGRLVYDEAWRAAGKKAWTVVEDNLSNTLKSLTKASTYQPKNLLKNTLNSVVKYTTANLTEGIQEVYQDAVSNTMTEYYKDRFYHPAIEGSRSIWGAFADNAGKTLSSEQGLETFASGFLMGSMVQVPQKIAFEWMPKKFWQLTDRESYDSYMTNMEKHTNAVVDALNAATMDDKFFDSITENAVQQLNNNTEARRANEAGDKKAFYDITDESVFNHMHTLLKSGKLNLITDQIKDLKKLDKKALEEAFGPVDPSEGDSYNYYQERLDGMLRKADLVEKHYQNIEERFKNPFNPSKYNSKKQPGLYQEELANYWSYEEFKKKTVYSSYAFDRAVSRMKGVMDGLVKDHNAFANTFFSNSELAETSASDFTNILHGDRLNEEIENLKKDVEIYRQGDEESKQKAETLQKKLDKLKDYKDAVSEFQTALQIHSVRRAGLSTKERSEAEKGAKVQVGTTVKNKKGQTVEVSRIKNGIAYDKSGNTIGRVKNLDIVEGASDVDFLDHASSNLYRAYKDYLKFISTGKGVPIQEKDIQASFEKLKDFYNLNQDVLDLTEIVDALHNPARFGELGRRGAEIFKELLSQKKAKLEESYKRFLRLRKTNDLFNQLYNMGVFLDEDGMKKVLDNQIPSTFYDISTKEPISEDSQKYKDILDLFEKYEETQDVTFEDKPIEDEIGDPEKNKYSSGGRNKINNDRRSYKEHAEYWGFDPNPDVSSKVNSRKVLQKIIDSPYATKREKMLARRLLAIVGKDSTITFGKLGRPGEFRYTAEAMVGTFIDARFMSNDYKGGKDIPIESIILHELIHEITSMQMMKDAEFKASITKLLAAAKEAYAKNKPTDKTLYLGATRTEFYGLKNEEEFLAELFSNDRFALWLDTIPYETTGETLWTEFMKQLQNFLARILGVRAKGTLLQEAVYIATSHINNIHNLQEPVPLDKAGKKEALKEEAPQKGALTPGSSIQEFATAGVLPALITAYREFVSMQEKMSPGVWPDTNVADKSDAQIAASAFFKEFLLLNNQSVNQILKAYNKKTLGPAPAAVPLTITRETRQQLLDLGYSNKDVDGMKPEEAKAIVDAGKTKPKAPAPEAPPVKPGTQLGLFEEPAPSELETKKADIEKRRQKSLTTFTYKDHKGSDMTIAESIITYADGSTEKISDFLDVTSKDSHWRLKQKINAKYDAELAALQQPTAAVSDKKADIERKKEALKGLIDEKYSVAYGLDPMGIPTDSKFVIEAGIGNILLEVKLTNDDLSDFVETSEKERLNFFKKIAERELAALEGASSAEPVIQEGPLELPIKNGKIVITTRKTDTYFEYYTFDIQDGKIVSGKRKTIFLGEYRDQETLDNLEDPEKTYLELSKFNYEVRVEVAKATYEQKQILAKELGYDKHWNEINMMTREEAAEIIKDGRTRQQRLEDEESARIAEREAEEAAKERTNSDYEKMIDEAEFISELNAIESEIAQAAFANPLDIDDVRLVAKIEAKKQELAKSVRFEDITKGEVIILKDGRRMIVEQKTGDVIKVRNFKSPGSRLELIYKKDVKDKVLYRDQPDMEKVDVNPPISPEAQEVSTQNIASAQNLNDSVKEDNDAVKNLTPEQVKDDFINSLGCK